MQTTIIYYTSSREEEGFEKKIRFVKDWDKVDVNKDWSVVLIDHGQFRRTKDAIRVKDNAEYVLLHDTERPWTYEYDKV